MMLRKLLTIFLISFSALFLAAAVQPSLAPETLTYKVMFKWGLINKKAGEARLTLSHGPTSYEATMAAASAPWADRIYKVRDTLNGRMSYADFSSLYYEKIAHEGSEHKHDEVVYDYSVPGVVRADCKRRVFKKGELKVDDTRQMQAEGKAIDMLTSFYYMRSLPFEKWKPGHVTKIDIFSGKRKELLSITYHGVVNLDVDGVMHPTYYVTFTFTSGGGKKTSDDMEAWISTDKSRIPLRLEGKLPIGKVHCLFTGRG